MTFFHREKNSLSFIRQKIDKAVQDDADRISRGETIKNYDRYFDENNFVQLLTLIPGISVGDEVLSLLEIAERTALGEELDLPPRIEWMINQAKDHRERIERQEAAFREEGKREVRDFFVQGVDKEQLGVYYVLDIATKLLCSIMGSDDIQISYYLKPDGSMAHAARVTYTEGDETKELKLIGWNLLATDTLDYIEAVLKKQNPTAHQRHEFWDTVPHELRHILEGSGQWTHNSGFYQGQLELVRGLLMKPDFTIEGFEETLQRQGWSDRRVSVDELLELMGQV
jgi:hypothetical protein